MVPASVDSVGKLLSDDGSSLIAQAFAKFSECSECRALMQTEGANSVAQFIKTEVVIESENAEGAIPLWPTSTGSGTAIHWLNLAAPPTLDKQLISSLLNRLGSGVIQTFVESCDGTSIGNCFLRNDINSSYQSITGPDTLLLVGGRNPPFFTWSRKEGENHPVALRKPTICDSMAGITPLLFSKFSKYYTVSSDRKIAEPVFAAGDHINPLDSFLYTSVDARAARVLRTFISSRIDSSIAEHLLSAGFSESAGTSGIRTQPNSKFCDELNRINGGLFNLKESYAPYISDVRKVEISSSFATELTAFRACATSKEIPRPAFCASIGRLVGIAGKGTGSTGEQTGQDQKLLRATEKFFSHYEDCQAATLTSRYQAGEVPLAELFGTLNRLWWEYHDFESQLDNYAFAYYKGNVPGDFTNASLEMRKHFENAFFQVQNDFLPLLRANVLKVRLERIEMAAKLLALHADEIKDLDAKEELSQLGNDLYNITTYPVGPAFDAKWGKN